MLARLRTNSVAYLEYLLKICAKRLDQTILYQPKKASAPEGVRPPDSLLSFIVKRNAIIPSHQELLMIFHECRQLNQFVGYFK